MGYQIGDFVVCANGQSGVVTRIRYDGAGPLYSVGDDRGSMDWTEDGIRRPSEFSGVAGTYVNVQSTPVDSPRARDVTDNVLPTECADCRVGIQQLAASEKERERLQIAVDQLKMRAERPAAVDALEADKLALRRELENLKRSTDSTIADYKGDIERQAKFCQEVIQDRNFLQRELDRERAKGKKRGI